MWGSFASTDRGQSEVLGVALLFGTVLTLSVAVVMGGATVLEQSHAQTSMQSAQVSMSELDREIEASASGGAAGGGGAAPPPGDESSFDGFSGEGEVEVRDSGWMNVTVTQGGSTLPPENVSLGAVVYERDGSEIAYQGGGVWRSAADSDESVMVSPPSMDYRAGSKDPTLTLPIVNVTGSASGSDFDLRRNGTEDVFPSSSAPDPTLTGDDELVVRVQSTYYRAWGEAFRDRIGGDVEYDHDKQMVIVRLAGEENSSSMNRFGAIEATGIRGTTQTINNRVEISSYDSSAGENPNSTENDNSRVVIRGDYKHNNDVQIDGHLVVEDSAVFDPVPVSNTYVSNRTIVGGPMTAKGDVVFEENVSVAGDLTVEGANPSNPVVFEEDVIVGGSIEDNASTGERFRNVRVEGDLHVKGDVDIGEEPVEVEGDIYSNRKTLGSELDRDGSLHMNDPMVEPANPASLFSNHSLGANEIANKNRYPAPSIASRIEATGGADCTPCELEDGNYSVDGINISEDERLVLDTTDGNISLHVSNGIDMRGAHIEVDGPNSVRIFNQDDLVMNDWGDNSHRKSSIRNVDTPYEASSIHIYQHHNSLVDLNRNSTVTGVIYGPGNSPSTAAEYELDEDVQIYGSIVGDPARSGGGISNDAEFHYDEALADLFGGWETGPQSREVRFVQVDSEEVIVED